MLKLNEFIKAGWGKARASAGERDLDLPYPFIPPSYSEDGMHRTLYYWDTYFTNVGLIMDGHKDWARENVDNLLYALNHFGCVPNYTRKDGADYCSQPPLLGLMIRDIYEAIGDEAWMKTAIESLEKEYEFWMTKRITPIGLNQYGCNATDETMLLDYYDYASTRVELPQDISTEEKIRIAKNFVAEGESGEDFTPRYANHNALDYVQIDLNAHLYGVEEILEWYYADKDEAKSAYYQSKKLVRLARIESYCFNSKTGGYCDYDFVSDKQSDLICAANFLPYFYGFARDQGNLAQIYDVLKTKGGVASCQDTGVQGYQWGYPYIWAPHQYFAYKALTRYDLPEQAEELRLNYTDLLSSVFEETGALWERYDENGAAADLEYPTQKMLGWTAAVYRYFVGNPDGETEPINSIHYNEQEKVFHIQTNNTSYVMCVTDHDALEHLYYGARIPDDGIHYISNRQIYGHMAHESRESRAFCASVQGFEVSAFNSGDIRTPSVVYNYGGCVDHNRLRYKSHRIYKGREEIEGLPYSREGEDTETLEVVLTDDDNVIELTLYYVVFAGVDVIARHQKIKNNGTMSLSITKFSSMCLDFYGMDFDTITLEGMYLYERAQVSRAPLKRGVFKNNSLTGTTSHNRNPFLALCAHNADEDQGDAYGFNLLYSSNFAEEVSVNNLGDTRVIAGIDDTGFSWILRAGESLVSPEAVMTYSACGLGGMSRNFHDHIRQHIIEKEFAFMPRPIVINSWEASYFTVTEEKVVSLAQHALDCGIDTVVLDDGWFRPHDRMGLGDWRTDAEKFPSGLKGLSEKIHEMGLKFGIWLEPEMVNEDSDLYRDNPHCVLATSKLPMISRQQYILDLTREEMVNKIADRISEELEGVEIDYIKWDFNRYATEAGSYVTPQGEVYHRQMLGAYKLLATLKQRLGNVMFETCSGGGGRFDLGMLYYSPQIWTSDNTDPYARMFIQNGTSYAYPVSALSCHFTRGDCTTGRTSTFDFRYRVAAFGSYGYELDLSEFTAEDKAKFKAYSEEYRKDEDLNLSGDLYRLISPESNLFCAYMKVAKDKNKAVLTFLEVNASGLVESTTLKLKGLDPNKLYKNEETGAILHGATLMNVGIRINDLFRKKREDGYTLRFYAVEKAMNIHNHYGYGQLFCFSGLEGRTSRTRDFVGMMMHEPITIRFHFDNAVTLKLPFDKEPVFKAVTGDMLDGEDFLVEFVDCNTICGKTPVKPLVLTEEDCVRNCQGDTEHISTAEGDFYLTCCEAEDGYLFSFSYGKPAMVWTEKQLRDLRERRYVYFATKPACKDKKYEKLYSKCLSIQKENVYAPEGVIPCRWTTPDRVPHRFLWLWDSAFHAMAFAEYDIEMAKDCIRAVLTQQREDGFIAHMMGVNGRISDLTQPQVLSWGVWSVYQKDGDKAFLQECAPALKKFLLWTIENRDKNGNGLLEWLTEPDYLECKCGESGLDNSPRFDFDVEMDAIDFSTHLCNDAKYLSWIFEVLGEEEDAEYFMDVHNSVKEKINELLWNEEDGLYYDRLFDGNHTRVASQSSFLPMFAGICSQEQADKMVKVLLDENRFWTAMPIPSMPKDSPFYDIDMWRGCSWLNLNYFTILGLRKYGYMELAEELRQRSLNTVYKWYEETGNIFEFYDADDEVNPFHLKRKGEQPETPDYRVHVHSITDYNWSSCFTMMMIQELWK